MPVWDREPIKKGMTAQLATRRARIAAGEKPLGWKVGLGAPETMKKLSLESPLVGFLMQAALVPAGSSISLKDYVRPAAECEIAVRMASDLKADATPTEVMVAIKEIGPAIEIADLDPIPAPDNLDTVLACDIFQRHVILGDRWQPGGSVRGLTSRLIRRGEEAARTGDPEALTGRLVDIVAHVANTLAAFGDKLSAGDIVITGSITAPLLLEADETDLGHALDPIGEVSVHFTRA